MEEATELHWLQWFHNNADSFLTEEQRHNLERLFVEHEGVKPPAKYSTLPKEVEEEIETDEEAKE